MGQWHRQERGARGESLAPADMIKTIICDAHYRGWGAVGSSDLLARTPVREFQLGLWRDEEIFLRGGSIWRSCLGSALRSIVALDACTVHIVLEDRPLYLRALHGYFVVRDVSKVGGILLSGGLDESRSPAQLIVETSHGLGYIDCYEEDRGVLDLEVESILSPTQEGGGSYASGNQAVWELDDQS